MTVDLSHYDTAFVRKGPFQKWHICGTNPDQTYCGMMGVRDFSNRDPISRGMRGEICLRCAESFKAWVGVDVLKEA